MELCYDGALVMPSSYVVMDEEEMTYVEGGITINRSTITGAVIAILGTVGLCGTAYHIGKVILQNAPRFAAYILGAGPLAQAAVAILAGFVAASAIALATIYLTGGSITLG